MKVCFRSVEGWRADARAIDAPLGSPHPWVYTHDTVVVLGSKI